MKRVRITSEGDYGRSRVVLDDTGEEVPSVRAIRVTIGMAEQAIYGGDVEVVPGEPAYATIEVVAPRVDIVADATITEVCPYCGHEQEQDDASPN